MQEELFETSSEVPVAVKKKKSVSGKTFEDLVTSLLSSCGWLLTRQYEAGYRLGKRSRHRVDIYAIKNGVEILVSCKYQDVQGTAPDKLPYEYMCLMSAVDTCLLDRAFIVLFGDVLIKSNMFARPKGIELSKYMTISKKVVVCGFEEFTRMAVRGELEVADAV